MTVHISPEGFVSVIRDEIDAIRDIVDGYYELEANFKVDFEMPINHLPKNRRDTALKLLHSPLTTLGFRLDDTTRHIVFSQIFGRTITSAYDVTNIEALAFSRATRANMSAARKTLEYLLGQVSTGVSASTRV